MNERSRLPLPATLATPASSASWAWKSPARRDQWDPPLARAGGSLLQSWDWGEFKKESGWSPLRLALAWKDGAAGLRPALAAQVLFKSLPGLPLPISVAYIPRGPLSLTSESAGAATRAAFWKHIQHVARKRGAIFLKVEPEAPLSPDRSQHHVDEEMARFGFRPSGRLQPARTIVLDLDHSEDELLKAMKPKTRYNIKLAQRRGVQVRQAASLADLRQFYNLLLVTGERDEFGIHAFDYYAALWSRFRTNQAEGVTVLLADHPYEAERSSGPIAGLLALRFGTQVTYMYGASANTGREHMPNYLLQWEAIRWAQRHGCTQYDFWGIPDPPSSQAGEASEQLSPTNTRSGLRGVYWFKKGFGGREIDYPGAYDLVYNRLLYGLWLKWRGNTLG